MRSSTFAFLFVLLCLPLIAPIAGATQQGRTRDLPNSGPPSLEDYYRPWRRMPLAKPRGWVRDYEPSAAEKSLLLIEPADQQNFANLLSQPNAGGFRLLSYFPRSRVVSINSPELSRKPGFSFYASSYSFTRRKHGHGVSGWNKDPSLGWIDLRLKDGVLRSGVMQESLGLIVQLGDVPLEEVTEQTAGVAEVAEFIPPNDYRTAVAMFEKQLRGYRLDGFRYGSKAVAEVNNTYVLRSMLSRRSDQLIVFRVVREDEEGSLSIVWRKLKDYPKPSWNIPTR